MFICRSSGCGVTSAQRVCLVSRLLHCSIYTKEYRTMKHHATRFDVHETNFRYYRRVIYIHDQHRCDQRRHRALKQIDRENKYQRYEKSLCIRAN
jgi:hypothetical protein